MPVEGQQLCEMSAFGARRSCAQLLGGAVATFRAAETCVCGMGGERLVIGHTERGGSARCVCARRVSLRFPYTSYVRPVSGARIVAHMESGEDPEPPSAASRLSKAETCVPSSTHAAALSGTVPDHRSSYHITSDRSRRTSTTNTCNVSVSGNERRCVCMATHREWIGRAVGSRSRG